MKKKRLSCFIVGDDNITLQCATIILAGNHELLGLVSRSEKIKEWCATNHIPYIRTIQEFERHYVNRKFDFLFSIVNSQILSPKVMNLPRYYAINYHNSPLPKYAGLYATTWAILNGESHHAITWHVMNEEVDAGDILKQRFFPINEQDTALSLNLKCYEEAVDSFRELIDELSANWITPIKQDLSLRTYYGLRDKPANFGFVSWDQPSDDIDRFCRAFTFGNYRNELVIPKIILRDQIFHLNAHKTLTTSSAAPPGQLVAISDQFLQIATATFDIAILELTDLKGKIYPIKDLIRALELNTTLSLERLEIKFAEKLVHFDLARNPKIEQFWVKEFLKCSKEKVSFLSNLIHLEKNKKILSPKVKIIPNHFLRKIQNNFDCYSLKNILSTAILIYLYRLNNYKNLSVDFSRKETRSQLFEFKNLFSDYVPLTTHFNRQLLFVEALSLVSDEYVRLAKQGTYAKDIFIRYPELKNQVDTIDISFTFVDRKEEIPLKHNKKLNIYISNDGSWFYVHNTTNSNSFPQSYGFLRNIYDHILTLLSDILFNPAKKLYELSILGKKERHKLLVAWNNTYRKYDKTKFLHQYFEDQAVLQPNNIAAVFEGQSISYQQLNHRANQFANYLRNLGIKPNHLIGLSLNRSIELLVCILGTLKSGAAYLPLDPYYPKERINYMLKDSGAHYLVFDQESNKHKLNEFQGKIITINSLDFNQFPTENLTILNASIDLAYVIYTSGTTGKPKGVAISHGAACNHMVWMQKEYNFDKNDIFLQKTPFSFDASVWEFFMPLFVGAQLIIASPDAHACPIKLTQLIQENKVSVLQLVPSMLKELISTTDFAKCTSLTHLFCGGETLLAETIHAFFDHHPSKTSLHNLYGPTETTIDAISATCTLNDAKSQVSRIGKPIMNTQLYVLDEEKQLVPAGVIGELYIGGDGLARGYLNNPDYTAEKFIPNPFSTIPGDRLYKTGDLVKWQSNGHIEYHGRMDCQVKIRGFRIELSEIESTLEKISHVHQCIVKPELHANGSHFLTAYIVLKKNTDLSSTELRDMLKQQLPDYMVPSRYFIVDKLLVTPSGKLDRKNLPTPLRQLNLGSEQVEPSTDIEKSLKRIWCIVLKIRDLGVEDDFFELGGNSLSAMRIMTMVKDQLSVTLSIRKIFDCPTIRSLAKEIHNAGEASPEPLKYLKDSVIVPIKKTGKNPPLFLVHPIGGSVFWYKRIGKYLYDEIPLYAIQDPGLDRKEFIFETLEEMANTYIQAIQAIQPKGPYVLGGASFGSTVAIEMAKQLEEKGETISSIVSLDGWASYPILQKNEAYFREIMNAQNSRILKKYIKNNLSSAHFLLELQWHRENMLMNYKLSAIRGKFILFKAKVLTAIFNYDAHFNWWDNFTMQPIELHLVPGDHETMFYEPNVRVLAQKLNKSLTEKMCNYSHPFFLAPQTKDLTLLFDPTESRGA